MTSSGTISTISGTGTQSYSGDGGQSTTATLNTPSGVAVDAAGRQIHYQIFFLRFICAPFKVTYTLPTLAIIACAK